MDFMPDKEFHKLFNRVSRIVNLKGAGTPQEINRRLKQKMDEYMHLRRKDQLAVFHERSQWRLNLEKLRFRGFARRVIDEAIANPHGEIALILKYGTEKAGQILRWRARRRLRW